MFTRAEKTFSRMSCSDMDRWKSVFPGASTTADSGNGDEALRDMDGASTKIYGSEGRRSIPPERLLRALLLQLLYSVRSERMLMEQLEYSLLCRWFVGLSANEPVWHATVDGTLVEAWAGQKSSAQEQRPWSDKPAAGRWQQSNRELAALQPAVPNTSGVRASCAFALNLIGEPLRGDAVKAILRARFVRP